MNTLTKLKFSALLHDIGKPICWAESKGFTRHAYYTEQLVSKFLGGEIAETAKRHHSSQYYESAFKPRSGLEKIISLADNIASGADRPEEAYKRRVIPHLPIALTHPLSTGDPIRRYDSEDLLKIVEAVEEVLTEVKELLSKDEERA